MISFHVGFSNARNNPRVVIFPSLQVLNVFPFPKWWSMTTFYPHESSIYHPFASPLFTINQHPLTPWWIHDEHHILKSLTFLLVAYWPFPNRWFMTLPTWLPHLQISILDGQLHTMELSNSLDRSHLLHLETTTKTTRVSPCESSRNRNMGQHLSKWLKV